MPLKKSASNTQGRRARDAEGDEGAVMDDELAEQVDGLEIDDEAPLGGKAGRKGGSGAILLEEEIERKAGVLARLAMFTEYKRGILKREDINKKVMGGNSKSFSMVLERANKYLKVAMGYEIVELMSRTEREQLITKHGKQGRPTVSSKMYIVRSTLDPSLIKLACVPDQDISNQEKEDGIPEDLVGGSILSWQTVDQIASYGILFVILSLILVHGKTIPDTLLRSQLKRLRLGATALVEVGTMACPRKITMEQFLTLLIRQCYLDRIKTGPGAPGPGAGAKRGRPAARGDGEEGEEGEFNLEWRWGERAQAEISERGVCDFMVGFMVERSRPEGGRPEGAVARRERLMRVEKQVRRDIKRAAAGELSRVGDEQDIDEEGGGEDDDEDEQ